MKYFIFMALAIWVAVAFTGCTKVPAPVTPPPVVEPPKPEPVKIVSAWPDKSWDKLAIEALEKHGSALLQASPLDAKEYCPNFSNLNLEKKKAFYVLLISEMARYESSFKPSTTYKENFKDAKGNYIVSAGLLQLSLESGNARIYQCGLKATSDLFDVATNLNCGVKILNHWVPNDKYIGKDKLGGARYWAVLRPHSKVELIKAKTKALEICK